MGRRSSTGRGALAAAAGAVSRPPTAVKGFVSCCFQAAARGCESELESLKECESSTARHLGRCALLGRAAGAPRSPRSFARGAAAALSSAVLSMGGR